MRAFEGADPQRSVSVVQIAAFFGVDFPADLVDRVRLLQAADAVRASLWRCFASTARTRPARHKIQNAVLREESERRSHAAGN
jgi:hypothetical protein